MGQNTEIILLLLTVCGFLGIGLIIFAITLIMVLKGDKS